MKYATSDDILNLKKSNENIESKLINHSKKTVDNINNIDLRLSEYIKNQNEVLSAVKLTFLSDISDLEHKLLENIAV